MSKDLVTICDLNWGFKPGRGLFAPLPRFLASFPLYFVKTFFGVFIQKWLLLFFI